MRFLLGAALNPRLGLFRKNYERKIFERLVNDLDFSEDVKNINSQVFMWYFERFLRRKYRDGRYRRI